MIFQAKQSDHLTNITSGVDIDDLSLSGGMPGNHRYLRVFRFGDPKAKIKAYLQAGLHGGEHPGMLVLHQLAHMLRIAASENQLAGQILLAPVSNPIGITQRVQGELLGRFNLSTGQNFNRGFPQFHEQIVVAVKDQLGSNGEYNTKIVRETILQYLETLVPEDELASLQQYQLELALQSDYVIDLHCDGESLVHIYGSESGKDIGEQLSRQLSARALLLGTDNCSQCFDDTVNGLWDHLQKFFPGHPFAQRSIAATVELRGRADVDITYANTDADNLYRVLQHWGLILGDPGPFPEAITTPTPLQAMFSARAKVAGLVVYKKALGDVCEIGETIAEIVDPNDPFRTPLDYLTTPVSGVLFSRHISKLVFPNNVLFKIAGKQIPDKQSVGCLLEK